MRKGKVEIGEGTKEMRQEKGRRKEKKRRYEGKIKRDRRRE